MNAHTSVDKLNQLIELAKNQVQVGAKYVHYRDLNSPYLVIGIGIQEATEKPTVIYQKEAGPIWVRDLDSWLEPVSVDGVTVARFQIL